ncbi:MULTISPECIES: MFS transporter [Nocardiopsis]|uniref:MFS transporter n=1 Tax=Nocardiopsis TaxID=2013 RepID=UPI0014796258|nr:MULTISPECIES: MFS transporter [Nocardiopsis]
MKPTGSPARTAPSPARVVAASALVLALSGPGQTAGVSVFVDHLVTDLDVSRSAVSLAYMCGTLSGALALPWLGRAVDRFGVQRVLAAVALGFGGFLVLLACVQGLVGLTAGFVGVRALGQGGMSLIASTAVAISVTRGRGTLLGLTTSAGSAGISLFPLVAEQVVSVLGWRYTFAAEALLIWVVVLPLAFWGLRGVARVPERTGEPAEPGRSGEAGEPGRSGEAGEPGRSGEAGEPGRSGEAGEPGRSGEAGGPGRSGEAGGPGRSGELEEPVHAEPAATAEPEWPLRAIVRTSVFWALTGAVACSGLVSTAVFFHQIAVLGEQGLTPTQAAANFLPQTVAGLGSALLFGSAADRVSPKALMCAAMAMHALALTLLPLVSPGLAAVLYGMALGAAASGARAVENAALPFYFGTANLGSLRGVTQSVAVASTAVGPILLSLAHEWAGSYRPGVLGLALLCALMAVAVCFARRPVSPRRRAAGAGHRRS